MQDYYYDNFNDEVLSKELATAVCESDCFSEIPGVHITGADCTLGDCTTFHKMTANEQRYYFLGMVTAYKNIAYGKKVNAKKCMKEAQASFDAALTEI